ncbi:hypothetical protein [Micromonospora sp. WMMD1082]|uniref:hypothetical protein n=1 Tax=Micromonospora sp. WMMD1082 TaxID=3016104 RepID=UPI002416716D|nr:hypothetical protein [Micromonospora sp. WMMD1082]MDG4796184.1 hypothetical protein [Micromonospora sp. WMMD1082]
MSVLFDPDAVPTHLTDRAHTQCRNLADLLIKVMAEHPADAGDVKQWLADIQVTILAVIDERDGTEHYESILAGVAALALRRLAEAGGSS